eukprot:1161578-Pelagomonas_calceolata.AAC.1
MIHKEPCHVHVQLHACQDSNEAQCPATRGRKERKGLHSCTAYKGSLSLSLCTYMGFTWVLHWLTYSPNIWLISR